LYLNVVKKVKSKSKSTAKSSFFSKNTTMMKHTPMNQCTHKYNVETKAQQTLWEKGDALLKVKRENVERVTAIAMRRRMKQRESGSMGSVDGANSRLSQLKTSPFSKPVKPAQSHNLIIPTSSPASRIRQSCPRTSSTSRKRTTTMTRDDELYDHHQHQHRGHRG